VLPPRPARTDPSARRSRDVGVPGRVHQVLIGAAQAVLPTNPIGSRGGKNVARLLMRSRSWEEKNGHYWAEFESSSGTGITKRARRFPAPNHFARQRRTPKVVSGISDAQNQGGSGFLVCDGQGAVGELRSLLKIRVMKRRSLTPLLFP
jgi:hypothetical protein